MKNDRMFPEERRLELLEIIREKGAVKITELSEIVGVSKITTRRDLAKLEDEGYIRRTHGGVFSLEKIQRELSFDEKIVVNLVQKKRIGRKAASLIQDNDTICISTGTTTVQILADIDRKKNLAVFTNCLLTGYELSKLPKVRLSMMAGEMRRPSYALVGPKAVASTKNTVINKYFLGVEGISLHYGITITSELEAEVCRKIIESSRTLIVVADSTKFGNVALAKIVDIDKIHVLVTDSAIKSEYVGSLKDIGVDVVIA